MALSTPTTKQIADAIVASIEAETSRTFSLFPKSFTRVLAKGLSGVFVLVYRYAGFALLQQFAQHASFRETTVNGRKITPLIEWGRLVGVGDPAIATSARLTVSFDVLDDTGSPVIAAGTQLVHPETGVIYITESDVTLSEPNDSVIVNAASDPEGNGGAGSQGNRELADNLQWANPIPQVSSAGASVTAILTTAVDAETEAAYRERVVNWFGGRPQGGAYADYRVWATSVNGIINAYPYTGDVPGLVEVYCEADDATGDEDGRPSESQLEDVKDAIELDDSGLATRRPLGVEVKVYAIFRQLFDVEVTGLSPDDDATKSAVEAALDDYLRDREPFILGLTKLPRKDRVTTAAISGVVDAAAATQGAIVQSVIVKQGSATIGNYTLSHGQKAKLGSTTYA